MRSPVRLRGTVRSVDGFRRISLVAHHEIISSTDEGTFVLAQDEGDVTIESGRDGLKLIGAKPAIERGAWSELKARPGAAELDYGVKELLEDVELHTITVLLEEPIEVYATQLDDGGKRFAAEVIAFGEREDAMRAMTHAIADHKIAREHAPEKPKLLKAGRGDPGDPASRRPPVAWLPVMLVGLVCVVCGVIGALSHSRRTHWEMALAATVCAAAIFPFRPQLAVPAFRRREAEVRIYGGTGFTIRLLVASMPIVMLSFTHVDFLFIGSFSLAPLTQAIVAGGFIAAWIGSQYFWDREGYQLHAALVDANCEGFVSARRPATVAGRKVALGMVMEIHKALTRYSSDEVKKRTLTARGPFTITTKDGPVDLDPEECVWATTVRTVDELDFTREVSLLIPIDGQLAGRGNIVTRDDGTKCLRSIGTRPVVVLATSAKGHPRRLAKALTQQRRVTLAGLAVAAAIIAVLGVGHP